MIPALPVIILMFPVGKVQMFANVLLGLPPNLPQNALKPPTGSYLVGGGVVYDTTASRRKHSGLIALPLVKG